MKLLKIISNLFFCIIILTCFQKTGLAEISNADNLIKQGRQAYDNGQFAQAVRQWKTAAVIYGTGKQAAAQIDALCLLARAYQSLGQYPAALESLDAASELAQKIKDERREADVMAELGRIFIYIGDLNQARYYLKNALKYFKAHHLTSQSAAVLNNLGNLSATGKRYDRAEQHFKQCLGLAAQAPQNGLAARASLNLARLYCDTEKYDQALPLLESVWRTLRTLDDTHAKAYSLISLAQLFDRIRQSEKQAAKKYLQKVYQTLKAAETTALKIGDIRANSYALGYMGALYESQQRHEEALHLTRQAVIAIQSVNAPESLFRWQWQSGRLYTSLGESEKAIAAYRRAVHTLQAVRDDLATPCRTCIYRSFLQFAAPVYLELADLLLRRSSVATDPQKSRADLSDARNVMEQLKIMELQDYFKDECVTALQAKETVLEQVSPDTAVVYPIRFKGRLELLVSFDNELKRYTVPVGSAQLKAAADALRVNLERPRSMKYRHYARQLYRWLILPFEEELNSRQIDTLVFVPDGPLRTIPMAALYDSKTKQFLIQKYALATTPSLTLTASSPLPAGKGRMLLNGLTVSVQGFAALPNISSELTDIGKIFDSTVLLNQDFTISNMEKTHLKNVYTFVHIATHGQFHSNSAKTFLLTYDQKLGMDDLQRITELGRFREQPVELLTLSACQTAVGDERAALGLAGVAVKGGARSALASLWFINDKASSMLVTAFYRELRKGSFSKAKALQKAQLTLLKDRRNRHPAYWAAFLLIGNWI